MKWSFLLVCAFSVVGCADAADDERLDASEDDLLRKTGPTSHWSYQGLLPELESPKLTVSLEGHTVHVEGLLPRGHRAKLPFHAKTEEAGARTKVHVVYPIATVNPQGRLADGTPTRNPEPFTYDVCGGDNFHPTNAIGDFGGFPFIQYVCNHRDKDGRVRDGIAFHGPITTRVASGTSYWALQRGPVSHACNRMLGEHILELAHLIGFDRGKRGMDVRVIRGFDKLGTRPIDVDYAATGWKRPEGAVVFPLWQAVRLRGDGSSQIDFPRWACETSRCASMPPNARDPYTGRAL